MSFGKLGALASLGALGALSGIVLPAVNVNPVLSGIETWVDAALDSSFSLGYGGTIQSLTEQSHNSRVFSPINANNPNLLVRIAKDNWNGLPVICTNLAPLTGLASPAFDISTNFAANGTDITVFAVYRTDEPNFNPASLYFQQNTIGHYFRPVNSVGQARFFSAGGSLTGANADFLGLENIACMQRSGSTATIWLNGAQELTGTSTPTAIVAGTTAPMYIGASSTSGGGMHGDLAELIIYNRVLSTLERQGVENYLAIKWIAGV